MIPGVSGWAWFQQFALLEAKVFRAGKQVLGSRPQNVCFKVSN